MSRRRLLGSMGFAAVMAALITGGSVVGGSSSDLFISTSGVQERSATYGIFQGRLKYVEAFVESTEGANEAVNHQIVFEQHGVPCGLDSSFTEYMGKLKPKRALFEFGVFYPAAMSVPLPKKDKAPPKSPLDQSNMDEQKWTFKLQGGGTDSDTSTQNNTYTKVFKFARGGTPKCRRLCPDGVCIPPVPQQ